MINPGARVRSTYRARWTGIVLGPAGGDYPARCVRVRMTHDRHGRPVRKPLSRRHEHVLDAAWLEVLR